MNAVDPVVIPKGRVLRARIAVSVAFLVLGAATGVWAVHIPLVRAKLGIDTGVLGLALLTLAGGAVLSMPLTGWATSHFGSRLPVAVALVGFSIAAPLPILAPDVFVFFVAAFFFGLSMGGLDVSANVQASEVEAARGRPTMSSFHGFFSVGALLGAIVGAGVIGAGWGDGSGAAALTILYLAAAAAVIRDLLPGVAHASGPRFALPTGPVFWLGLLTLLCFAIEGAVTDWSALYLVSNKAASPTEAATGFALFSLAMAGCRLFGDPVVAKLGHRTVMVGGGLLMAAGVAGALLAPSPILAAIGFTLVGVGAANVVPVAFSVSARTPGVAPGAGVAAVATLGYFGFLAAPPLLGFVGEAWGLGGSLAIVLAMALAVALIGLIRR